MHSHFSRFSCEALNAKADPFPGISVRGSFEMALFCLLPPRPLLAPWLANCLQSLLPEWTWTDDAGTVLAEALAAAAARRPDVFVVHREELPEGESPARALADGYGAEPGDEVLEVRPGSRSGEWKTRRWRLQDAA
jgi:hypothetical protein